MWIFNICSVCNILCNYKISLVPKLVNWLRCVNLIQSMRSNVWSVYNISRYIQTLVTCQNKDKVDISKILLPFTIFQNPYCTAKYPITLRSVLPFSTNILLLFYSSHSLDIYLFTYLTPSFPQALWERCEENNSNNKTWHVEFYL